MNHTFFPIPMDDESGLSLMIRTAIRRDDRTLNKFCQSISPSLGLSIRGSVQSAMNLLLRWLVFDAGYSADAVMTRFSNFPIQKPFLRERYSMFEARSIPHNDADWTMLKWFQPLGARIASAKFCQCCANEQYEESSTTAWLRSHQVDHVTVCWKHACLLENASLSISELTLPEPTEDVVECSFLGTAEHRIAVTTKKLMDADLPWMDFNGRAALYRHQLSKIERHEAPIECFDALMERLKEPKVGALLLPGESASSNFLERNVRLIDVLFDEFSDFEAAYRASCDRLYESSTTSVPGIKIVDEIKQLECQSSIFAASKSLFLLAP